MADVWGPRQRAEIGPDPFEAADLPESDPLRSASGEGRKAGVPAAVLRMLAEKRAEAARVRAERGDVDRAVPFLPGGRRRGRVKARHR